MIRDACRSTCDLCFSLVKVPTELVQENNETFAFPSSAPTISLGVLVNPLETSTSSGVLYYPKFCGVIVSLSLSVFIMV